MVHFAYISVIHTNCTWVCLFPIWQRKREKKKHPPHVEVRWFMSRFSPNLETVATQKTCRAVTQGHVRGKTAQSKYSHKLTKVDTSTDVFDKFRLLCVFKCEPDGGEQQGLARSLIVCGGYTQGTLELIRAEERAFLTPEKKKKKAKEIFCRSTRYSDLILSSTSPRACMHSHCQCPVSTSYCINLQPSIEIKHHQLFEYWRV